MVENVRSQSADSIRGENLTLQMVCLNHLNRINELMSKGRASVGGANGYGYLDTYYGLVGGLAALESSISFKLQKDYWQKSLMFKNRIRQLDRSGNIGEGTEFLFLCSGWYSLLVRQLNILNLLPTEREVFDFEE
jgi:hypothetical protein